MHILYSRQLFCALTRRYLNRIPEEVRHHISGKRYKKALLECEWKSFIALPLVITATNVDKCGERELSSEFRGKHQNKSTSAQAPVQETDKAGRNTTIPNFEKGNFASPTVLLNTDTEVSDFTLTPPVLEEEGEEEEDEEDAMEVNGVLSDGESAGEEGSVVEFKAGQRANGEDSTENSQGQSLSRKKRKRERRIQVVKKLLKMRRSKVSFQPLLWLQVNYCFFVFFVFFLGSN